MANQWPMLNGVLRFLQCTLSHVCMFSSAEIVVSTYQCASPPPPCPSPLGTISVDKYPSGLLPIRGLGCLDGNGIIPGLLRLPRLWRSYPSLPPPMNKQPSTLKCGWTLRSPSHHKVHRQLQPCCHHHCQCSLECLPGAAHMAGASMAGAPARSCRTISDSHPATVSTFISPAHAVQCGTTNGWSHTTGCGQGGATMYLPPSLLQTGPLTLAHVVIVDGYTLAQPMPPGRCLTWKRSVPRVYNKDRKEYKKDAPFLVSWESFA